MESIITFTYCSKWNHTNDQTLIRTIIYSLSIPTHTELSAEDVVRIEGIGYVLSSYEGLFG